MQNCSLKGKNKNKFDMNENPIKLILDKNIERWKKYEKYNNRQNTP